MGEGEVLSGWKQGREQDWQEDWRQESLLVLDQPVRLYANGVPETWHGPWLLALHGSGAAASHWRPLADALAGRLLLVAPDLPGHGGTDVQRESGDGRAERPPQASDGRAETSVADYAAWLAGLINGLRSRWPQLGDLWLMGHSLGGAIAIETALTYDHLAQGLVLVGTGARLRVQPDFLGRLQRGEVPAELKPRLDALSTAPTGEVQGREEARLFLADLLACDRWDRLRDVARLTLPTLVLAGGEDQLTPPKYAEYLGSQVRGARVVIVPDATHFVMIEEPAVCADLIVGFLRGQHQEPPNDSRPPS